MHKLGFLHKRMAKACESIHATRVVALFKAVAALLEGRKLTLTHLGRHLASAAYCKHNIKCMDRLLGNEHLQRERLSIYRFIAESLLCMSERPLIVVDWSDCPGHKMVMLKAAVPVGGRALSLYAEVHPLKHYNKPWIHKAFLARLAELVPAWCRPIIVTDAGFQGPWFRAVEQLGWNWVGRVRGRVMYRAPGAGQWQWTKQLHGKATARAVSLGAVELAKSAPYGCWLYLMRGPKKYRLDRPWTREHGHNTVAERCRRMHKEPWLIASNLSPEQCRAKRVMAVYEQRMQIEETFRDIKSHRYGYGLDYSRTRDPKRLEILLLIATLAMLAQWLMGLMAKEHGWMRHFQANTVTNRAVLSLFFLGGQLLVSPRFELMPRDLERAFGQLPMLVAQQVPAA